MKQMKKLGPMKEILKLLPGMGDQAALQMDDGEMEAMEAIIQSMTPQEREDPTVIEASRRRRIARGSGTSTEDVSGLVKSFTMAANMMKQMAGMGMRQRMDYAKQVGQISLTGAIPRFKVKQRSHRLTKKERERLRKKKRRR
jgi:signal recognition particle GTPase